MTHVPLHGISDTWNIQWIKESVYLPFGPSQMPLVHMGTNQQDCLHVEADRGSF